MIPVGIRIVDVELVTEELIEEEIAGVEKRSTGEGDSS